MTYLLMNLFMNLVTKRIYFKCIFNYIYIYTVSLYSILFYSKENLNSINKFDDYSKFYQTNYSCKCNKIYKPNIKKGFYVYVVLTLSNPCNIIVRNIQRYYRSKFCYRILFIYVTGISECKNLIYYEKYIFGDILYLNIKNHYFNITLLFLKTINWINMNLKYDYLIKWDDDIIVNIPLLFIFVNTQKLKLHYSGYMYNKTKVCRNRSKICFVPYSIYNESYLPPFIASGILILSNFASHKLDKYHKIYKSYLIRDDQYIGVIYNLISIKPLSINKYYIRVNVYNTSFKIKTLLSYHTNNINELIALYNKIHL